MEDLCSICYEKMRYPVTLTCGHKYCFICIKSVKETTGCCPLCRQDIDIDLDKLSIYDVVNTTEKIFPCIKWLYGSRDGKSWWYYDDNINNIIEENYKKWMTNKERPEQFNVGHRMYDIDFDKMEQLGQYGVRKMKRQEFLTEEDKNDFDDFDEEFTRGVTGVYFKKN